MTLEEKQEWSNLFMGVLEDEVNLNVLLSRLRELSLPKRRECTRLFSWTAKALFEPRAVRRFLALQWRVYLFCDYGGYHQSSEERFNAIKLNSLIRFALDPVWSATPEEVQTLVQAALDSKLIKSHVYELLMSQLHLIKNEGEQIQKELHGLFLSEVDYEALRAGLKEETVIPKDGLTVEEKRLLEHGIKALESKRGKVDHVHVVIGSDFGSSRVDVREPAKEMMIAQLEKVLERLKSD